MHQAVVGQSQRLSVSGLVLSHHTHPLAVLVQVVLVALLLLVPVKAPQLSCPSSMLPSLLLAVDLKLTLRCHHVSVLTLSVELVEPWLELCQQLKHFVVSLCS